MKEWASFMYKIFPSLYIYVEKKKKENDYWSLTELEPKEKYPQQIYAIYR